ncbi:hypothetical protein [Psychromonas aquatilis]|uniref:HEAT repeat protein n=1 Tax=Psychromonas aquatilis TaxID=2005072 RepID=A0ABU9GRA8_9GAMM
MTTPDSQSNFKISDNNINNVQIYNNVSDNSELSSLLDEIIFNQNTQEEYNAFFLSWMIKEPLEIMAYLLNLNDDELRFSMLLFAMEAWSEIDPDELNKWLLITQKTYTLDFVIVSLAKNNILPLRLAIQYAEKINNTSLRDKSITEIIQSRVYTDIYSVIELASNNNIVYREYGQKIYELVIKEDIEVALSYTYLLSDKDNSVNASIIDIFIDQTFKLVSTEQFSADNIALVLLSLPHTEFSSKIIDAISPIILSSITIDNAISLIDSISNDGVRDMMQQEMVALLMQDDISSALNYINYFENDEKRQETFDTIIYHWANQDLYAASEWLTSVDISNSSAGFSLAQIAIKQNNIDIAREWVKKIESRYDVDEMHYLIFKELYKKDTDLGISYINDQTNFSEQDIYTILNSMNNN